MRSAQTEYRLAYGILGLLVVVDALIGYRIFTRLFQKQAEVGPDGPAFVVSLMLLQILLISLFGRLRQLRSSYEQMRQSNEEELEFVHQLLDTSTEGIVVYSADGRVSYLNRRASEILGHEHQALIGRDSMDIVWPGDAELVQSQAQQNWGVEGQVYRLRIRDAQGNARAIEVTSRPRWYRGRIVGAFAAIRPIDLLDLTAPTGAPPVPAP